MWFRAEIAKDGSIASLEQVEGAFKSSHRVLYVEADNKAQAASRVLVMYRARRQKASVRKRDYRARNKALGLCSECGKAPPRPGLKECQPCADVKHRPPVSGRPQKSELERAAAYVERDQKRSALRREVAREVGETHSSLVALNRDLTLLTQALVEYDRSNRRWFEAEIYKRRERIEAFRRALAEKSGTAQPVAAE